MNTKNPRIVRQEAIAAVKSKAQAEAIEFFHDPLNEAYATVPVREHRETWRIGSRDFELWVAQSLYDAMKSPPSRKLVREVLHEFEMHAVCRGLRHEVFVRVAEHEGRAYIDLANDNWEAIEVAGQWRIVREPPVKFRRQRGMDALPYPARGGTLQLRRFWNFSPESELLVMTWLSYALLPNHGYPILALTGVQGAGKSTITRLLSSLIDPSVATLTTTPRSERDLAIAASNGHLIAMDNLSAISEELSDAMCRVATGGSFRTRRLYTDTDEVILTYKRPLVINAIEEVAQRPDLLDRCLLIRLAPISEEQRRDEGEFWREFEGVRPTIFGALLDVICKGLRRLDDVKLTDSPRMADFAKWGVAVEQALGGKKGQFLSAYRANIQAAGDAAVEASPIAVVLREVLASAPFDGTGLHLLTMLNNFISVTADTARKHPRWPKSAQQLSAEIGRIEPNLRKMGIVVERGRNHGGRFIRLCIDTTVTDRHGVAAAGA